MPQFEDDSNNLAELYPNATNNKLDIKLKVKIDLLVIIFLFLNGRSMYLHDNVLNSKVSVKVEICAKSLVEK